MTPGQLNYEGYCKDSGHKSLISGAPLPPWQDLDPKIKQAWEAGARAVMESVAKYLEEMTVAWDVALKAVKEAADKIGGM